MYNSISHEENSLQRNEVYKKSILKQISICVKCEKQFS